MLYWHKHHRQLAFFISALVILSLVLVGCASSTSTNGSASVAAPISHSSDNSQPSNQVQATQGTTLGQKNSSQSSIGPQYLIKSLQVSMEVNDTRQTVNDLEAWISTADPRSSTAGFNYQQIGDNLYNITVTFSVQATLYPQIQNYLSNYPSKHNGKLITFNETVQNVTNDYIDTQSRLKNLQAEQQRLLSFMSSAQTLNDTLAIEQRLTEVEGNIEQIEAHLNSLNDQITFYNIIVTLQPTQTSVPVSPSSGWNIRQIFSDALSGSIQFGQGLITFLIWLLAYAIYFIPVGALVWFFWWRRRNPRKIAPVLPSAPLDNTQSNA